jgi:[ribosomal protein S5]-alanine N-acetyltransferase
MIKTTNLRLVPCELSHFEAILNNASQLEQMLGVTITEGWLQFPESMQFGYEYLSANPDAFGWWTYLFVHAKDKALIGTGGFVGSPDGNGVVEIGYAIAMAYRNRGLATEAALGLVDYAFSQAQITVVDAHTLSEISPSTRVLEKIGMKKIGTAHDRDEGEVWHWRLRREDYEPVSSHHALQPRPRTRNKVAS